MEHLVPLGGGWLAWRSIWLRSAGFPISLLRRLESTGLAGAADRLEDARRQLAADAAPVIGRMKEARRSLKGRGPLRRIDRAVAALEAGQPPDLLEDFAGELEPLRARAVALDEEEARLSESFDHERLRVSGELRATLAEPAFREAVTWQNRRAIALVSEALSRRDASASDSKTRQQEALIAGYLQRYCAKNDTIGFFGPLCWASLDPDAPALTSAPGRGLLAARETYVEYWPMTALAAVFAADPALSPHLRVRRSSMLRWDGERVVHATAGPLSLPELAARILALADGEHTPGDIFALLSEDESLELENEEELQAALHALAAKELISHELDPPAYLPRPDRWLRERLAAFSQAGPARDELDRLEEARRAVAEAAGDSAALERSLIDFEARFARIAGSAATRNAGETYGARTPLYEDTIRDVSCVLGGPLLEALSGPLAILLRSVRWYTHRLGVALNARLAELFHEAGAGQPEVPYARIAELFSPDLTLDRTPGAIIRAAREELETRWSTLLGPLEGRRVQLQASSLEPRAAELFGAPGPGWRAARHHTPDLMIAAASAEAVHRGEYLLVLGELHGAVNTSLATFALARHPDPDALLSAAVADLEPGWARVMHRSDINRATILPLPQDDHLELGTTRSPLERSRVLPVADVVVRRGPGGKLVAGLRDGSRSTDLLDTFYQQLGLLVARTFRVLAPAEHLPRITIDRLVIQRESWRFDRALLPWCERDDARGRFFALRSWARSAGLPRWMFARVPQEQKPMYLDLESLPYVEQLARWVRPATALSLSEMLPGPEDCWLEDAAGARYTSELRMPVLDPLRQV